LAKVYSVSNPCPTLLQVFKARKYKIRTKARRIVANLLILKDGSLPPLQWFYGNFCGYIVSLFSSAVALQSIGPCGSMGNQPAHSSNRRMISMSLHPNKMREPHNMKGTP
jgi:hypothetical protein